MALIYQRLRVRGPYRVRLSFDQALGSGAFVPSWYAFTSEDDLGLAPTVMEALVVSGDSAAVELALDVELAPGAAFTLTITAGVPAASGPALAADATDRIVKSRPQQPASVERSQQSLQSLVYGEDLRHEAGDFSEQADGDLAGVMGAENAVLSVQRIAAGNGLAWDEEWGAHLREHVDAPSPSIARARGQTVAAVLRDDRVKSADASAVAEADGEATVTLDVDLIGGQRLPVSVPITR